MKKSGIKILLKIVGYLRFIKFINEILLEELDKHSTTKNGFDNLC